jgi:hypothetical protein
VAAHRWSGLHLGVPSATRFWQTFAALAVAGNLYGEFGLALASVAAIAMIGPERHEVWVLAHFAAPSRVRLGAT